MHLPFGRWLLRGFAGTIAACLAAACLAFKRFTRRSPRRRFCTLLDCLPMT